MPDPKLIARLAALLVLSVTAGAQAAPAQENAQPETGKTTALLIVDIQDFYFRGGALPLADPEPAAANAARLLAWFRAEGLPVVHVGHNAKQGKGFRPEVTPLDGEKVIFKDEVSAFKGSDLAEYLRQLGVTRLVVCGMQTHMCAEAAVRAAADLGFAVVMIADACATRDLTFGDRTVAAADVQASTLSTLDRAYARVMTCDGFLAAASEAK